MLDIYTLFVGLIASHAALAIALAVVFFRYHGRRNWPGLGSWLTGLCLIVAGWVLRLSGFSLPEVIHVSLGLGLVSAGFSMCYRGVSLHFGRTPSLLLMVALPILVTVKHAIWIDNTVARVSIVNAAFAFQCVLTLSVALRQGSDGPSAMRYLFIGATGVGALSIAARAVLVLVDPDAILDLMTPHPVNSISLLVSVMAGLLQQAAMMGLYLQRSAEESERLASIDPLTGAANRRAFEQACEVEVSRARRLATPVSLLALDIDRFKAINDRWGHGAGDRVLRHVTDELRSVLRATDVVARVGGEEFLVLLPSTPLNGAIELGERIRRHIEQLSWDDVLEPAASVTLSIGVSAWRRDEGTLAPAISRADRCLYEAKVAGRNRIVPGTDVVPAPG